MHSCVICKKPCTYGRTCSDVCGYLAARRELNKGFPICSDGYGCELHADNDSICCKCFAKREGGFRMINNGMFPAAHLVGDL